MAMTSEAYDLIVSLGGNCSAASQMRMRGLRFFSLPFDWLFMEDTRPIEYLANGFENGFSDFMLKENLVLHNDDWQGGVAKYKYKDAHTGFCFIHHFHKSIDEPGGYEAAASVMRHRINRLMSKIGLSSRILLILTTDFPFDVALAEKMIAKIRSQYPDKEIDFHMMQFGVVFDDPAIAGRKFVGMPFTGGLYSRAKSTYDLEKTSAEWAFLDEITLSGHSIPTIDGINKFRYKIWKSLSTRFLNAGFALKGVSFRS